MKQVDTPFFHGLSRWSVMVTIVFLVGVAFVPVFGVIPSESALPGFAKVDRDVTYGMVDGVTLKMDLYYPSGIVEPAPVAVYVHGGGWVSGDKASGAGFQEVQELVNRGYLVSAVNYRLAPRYKFPAQIEDVKCAIRCIRANAKKYGVDPTRIGAWGGSAGGHLVSLLGLTDASAGFDGSGGYLNQSSRVVAVVDMFGPTDLTNLYAGVNPQMMESVFGTVDRNGEIAKKASPVTYVSTEAPPFLILHGELDALVPLSQSQILYEKLKATGVPATLVLVKNAGHGFSPVHTPISPSRQEITQMVADFFDRYVKYSNSTDMPRTVSQTTTTSRPYVTNWKDFPQVKSILMSVAHILSEIGGGLLWITGVVFVSIAALAYILRKRRRSSDRTRYYAKESEKPFSTSSR